VELIEAAQEIRKYDRVLAKALRELAMIKLGSTRYAWWTKEELEKLRKKLKKLKEEKGLDKPFSDVVEEFLETRKPEEA
jgi:uncharacterized protein YihD (DUF1040 family)